MKKYIIFFISMFVLSANAQTSVAGVDFGLDYETAKLILENRFGKCDYESDVNTLVFSNKEYAGLFFEGFIFGFQRTANKSYMNRCIMVNYYKTAHDAITRRYVLKEVISKKYDLTSYKDEDGFIYYRGGVNPLDENKYGFLIDVFKLNNPNENKYGVRIYYGPYNYLNEGF